MGSLFLRIFVVIVLTIMLSWWLVDRLTEGEQVRVMTARHRLMAETKLQTLEQQLAIPDLNLRRKALEAASEPLLYIFRLERLDDQELSREEYRRIGAGEMVIQVHVGDWESAVTVYHPDLDPNHVVILDYLPTREESAYYMIVEICLYIGLALVIFFLVAPIVRRLRGLAATARKFGEGDLAARLPPGGPKAIADLGHAFNLMAEQLNKARIRHEIMTHALSHEVRTPLARLRLSLDMAEEMDLPEQVSAFVGDMQRDVDDLENLSDEMLGWAKLSFSRESLPMESIDLVAIAEEVADTLGDVCPHIPIEIHVEGERQCSGNAPLLVRALGNLVRNAQKYGAENIEIHTRVQAGECCLIVDDDGPGIPPEERERVLYPFAGLDKSRKSAGEGFGLGMAIVQQIVKSHGGEVSVEESPKGGARVRITWPETGPRPGAPKSSLQD
ncbi:MAG: ATP-binding protein [Acidobacteriota bacterium]|nr:ATP-binding protein [Acidobacteriota bacterium]